MCLIDRSKLFFLIFIIPSTSFSNDVSFSGRVLATPCQIEASTVNQKIDFGKIIAKKFSQENSAGEWKAFAVKFFDCPKNNKSISVTFSGKRDTNNTAFFSNSGTGLNAALQLANDDYSATYSDGTVVKVLIDDTRKANLFLAARVISPLGGMSSGTFSSIVQMSFSYE